MLGVPMACRLRRVAEVEFGDEERTANKWLVVSDNFRGLAASSRLWGVELVGCRSVRFLIRGGSSTVGGVVFSGGVMGSVKLLMKCKHAGLLPGISGQSEFIMSQVPEKVA